MVGYIKIISYYINLLVIGYFNFQLKRGYYFSHAGCLDY